MLNYPFNKFYKKNRVILYFKGIKSNEFARILLTYATSQVLGNILTMIAGLITVKLIDPSTYGYFTGKGIFLGYLSLAHLGVLNGLNRELPYEHGKKNFGEIEKLANLGFFVSLLIGIPTFIFFLFLSSNEFFENRIESSFLYLTYGIASLFLLLNKFYLPILYRTNQDFKKLSKISFLISIFNFASVLIIVFYKSINGLCARLILLNIVEFLFYFHFKPMKIFPKWSRNGFKRLIKVGLPIYIVGYIIPLFDTIKNNIIFSLGGGVQYGFYALTNVVNSALGMIPNSFGQIIYPKMAIALGEGKNKSEIVRIAFKPAILLLVIGVIIAFLGYFLLPIVVMNFLPKYSQGIEAALWILILPIISSTNIVNNYFNIYGLQIYYLIAILFGVLLSVLYLYFVRMNFGFNIVDFAKATLIGTLSQNVLCLFFVKIDLNRFKIRREVIK